MNAFKHLYFVEACGGVKISRRSVYYDICNIKDWLDSHNLPTLKIVRGKGILRFSATFKF